MRCRNVIYSVSFGRKWQDKSNFYNEKGREKPGDFTYKLGDQEKAAQTGRVDRYATFRDS